MTPPNKVNPGLRLFQKIPTGYNVKTYRLKISQLLKGRAALVSGGGMVEKMVLDGDGIDLTSKLGLWLLPGFYKRFIFNHF